MAGEITPDYALLDSDDFARMAQLGPDVRFLFVMRDPLARFLSGVRMSVRKRADRDAVTAERVTERVEEALSDPLRGALAKSRYDRTIIALEAAVPRDRIAYFFYETLFDQAEIDRLTDFLGISRRPADVGKRIYAGAGRSVKPDAPAVAAAHEALAPVYEFIRDRFGSRVPPAWQGPDSDAVETPRRRSATA